jgi:RimJ/RimL family protein N-acetyltransferase
MCDPDIADNIGLRREPTLERTRQWVREAVRARDSHPFAILWDDRHVGNVVLDRIDRHLGTARLSIYVGEADVRCMGVGREAIKLALGFAFDEAKLEKVWLTAHTRNVAAIRTYIDVGFRLEGIHRGEFLLGGQRLDEIYMGILREEYAQKTPKTHPR